MSTTIHVKRTKKFSNFLKNLQDKLGKIAILERLKRLEDAGSWGDIVHIRGGVIELRVHVGPGYRVYCKQVGQTVVIILGGGDKSSQKSDIKAAKTAAKLLKEDGSSSAS